MSRSELIRAWRYRHRQSLTCVRPALTPALEMTTWLRGIGVRQVRLTCGLVMFAYIFSHFFNHALGNISYAAMETWLTYHIWFWRIPVVNFTLYAAATTHAGLGLWALYQRRHFRYTFAEITQLTLGLSIPLLIALHFAGARVRRTSVRAGCRRNYASVLLGYWVARPFMIPVQYRSSHRRLDPRLHRALFLAAAEAVFQMGGAIFAGGRGAAAALGDARRLSGRRARPSSSPRTRNGVPST